MGSSDPEGLTRDRRWVPVCKCRQSTKIYNSGVNVNYYTQLIMQIPAASQTE